jgi:hypothetical protein
LGAVLAGTRSWDPDFLGLDRAAECFGEGSVRGGHGDPVVLVRLDEIQGGRLAAAAVASVGSAVLEAVLPPYDGPAVTVPVTMSDDGLAERDGVEAKTVIVEQLARALELIRRHDPARILTRLGQQLYRLSLRFRRL